MTMPWESLYALTLLIAANSTPWIVGKLSGGRAAWPMDGGHTAWDGERWLGSHKTWRGFIAGTLACATISELCTGNVWTGAGFGALSLIGDALSSCLKRRLHRDPGAETPLIDQIPECLLPLCVYAQPLALTPYEVMGVAAAFSVAGLALTRLRIVMFTLRARNN
jgi:CDP-2,3-bis-(O-geranylgeranyl)-sn-glycerol synthase